MLADLSGFVTALGTETLTFTRYNRDSYGSNGVKQARTTTSPVSALVSVQPVSGADLKRLPDGFSASEHVTLFSGTEIKMRDQFTLTRGGTWEVEHVEPWDSTGNFWKVIARRLQAGAES